MSVVGDVMNRMGGLLSPQGMGNDIGSFFGGDGGGKVGKAGNTQTSVAVKPVAKNIGNEQIRQTLQSDILKQGNLVKNCFC